jgi:hypothetical protein
MGTISIELEKSQFIRILNELDEITKEVESVRKQRYEKGKQVIYDSC